MQLITKKLCVFTLAFAAPAIAMAICNAPAFGNNQQLNSMAQNQYMQCVENERQMQQQQRQMQDQQRQMQQQQRQMQYQQQQQYQEQNLQMYNQR